jgi:hypothetical protein
MKARQAAFFGLLGCAVVLGAGFLWPKPAKPSMPAGLTEQGPGPAAESAPRASAPVRSARRPSLAPSPALPASAFEPMIDIPAGPPPLEGSGDDMEESKLPRRLFDGKVALEAAAPSPAKLEEAGTLLGQAISREARERVTEAFRKHNEAAAVAIGYFRLREISEEEAAALIRRAQEGYRQEAMGALGLSRAQFERLFERAVDR